MSNISNNSTATGGLPTTPTLAKTAKFMLTVNVDVCDGLVNGARSIVKEVVKISNKVITILIKFDDSNIEKAVIQASPYKVQYVDSIPI